MEYVDKNSRIVTDVPYPNELLIKDISFKSQSEVRIIVNSKSDEFLKHMNDNHSILRIGSIEDIATIQDYYYNSMEVIRRGNTGLMYSLPNPIKFNENSFTFSEYEDLLVNIVNGDVKITNYPQNAKTLNEKLEPLLKRIKDKYGVTVYVDEDKKISYYNVSTELAEELDIKHKNPVAIDNFKRKIESFMDNSLDLALQEWKKEECNKVLLGYSKYYQGKIYDLKGDTETALKCFTESYYRDVMPIESLDGITNILFREKDYKKAINTYIMIQEVKGYDPMIWGNIGIAYIHLGEYREAIDYFDKAIKMDQDDAFYYYNKAVALYKLGEYQEALSLVDKALSLDPGNDYYKQELKKFENRIS